MEIKVFKTHEVSRELWAQIVEGFNICFPEHQRSVKQLVERYTAYPLGYSYHALYYEDGKFAGFNSIIPTQYIVDGKDVLMGQSVDTYVLPEFRKDIYIFMELYNKLKKVCFEDGFIAFLGVPNQNSYQYSVKLLKCIEIFQLDYWILPVKIGNILGKMKSLNLLTQIYSWMSISFNILLSSLLNFQEDERRIHLKEDDAFMSERLGADKYINVADNKCRFSYTITEDEGIRCAYIMYAGDGKKRTYQALVKCASHILHHEDVDMMMFNGTMNMKQALLTRVPIKFQPRKLPFTVNFLKKEYKKEFSLLLDPSAWDFTLINLDVR